MSDTCVFVCVDEAVLQIQRPEDQLQESSGSKTLMQVTDTQTLS